MERQYCPICGKRIVPHTEPQTYTSGSTTTTFTLFFSDSTEPICFGHGTALSVYASGVERCQGTDAPSWEELTKYKRIPVPQAFYDAFSDDEVLP